MIQHSADQAHSHPPVTGMESRIAIYRDAKALGLQDNFRGTSDLIYEVLREYKDLPGSHLPDFANLRRAVNNNRAKQRPPNPSKDDVFFPVAENYFADEFYRGEVWAGGRTARHLVFASQEQLAYLAKCKRWYIDGTFKVVSRPFTQLLTINGFPKNDRGKF